MTRFLSRCFPLIVSLLPLVEVFAAAPFVPSAQPTGWIARPTLTNVDVSSGSEVYFRGSYLMTVWRGDLESYKIQSNGIITRSSADGWNAETAAAHLDDLDADTGRKIVTRNGSTGIPFRWSSLSASQRDAIDANDSIGQAVVEFLRGDRSNEAPNGLGFRARAGALGDIIHSTPYYWKHAGGVERIYVGANDGMLHAFDAQSGNEVFAYIPSMLIPKLRDLTTDPYVQTAFVDGQMRIARGELSGSVKTVLVGALGAGGKGLFALDITDPSPSSESDAANKILWEITPSSTGFGNLGYTYGTPRIARLNDGTAVAIIGNGYMSAGNGRASLLVIDLASGALVAEIDTGSGSTSSPSGLSGPTLLDTDSDGKVDYAYAGDIDGKLWKFDLVNWTASLLYTTSPAQAITVAPVVRPHPQGGYMVVFGTGRILTNADVVDTSVHYVYGIWDGAPNANDTLLTQTLSESTFGSGDSAVRVRTVTANAPSWTAGNGNHKGWKVALPAGERVVGEAPFHYLGRYYFTSTNPTVAAQSIEKPAGENWLHELDFLSGGEPAKVIFDLNQDGDYDSDDLAANGEIPVAKFMAKGVLSQPVLVLGNGVNTTVYNWHDNVAVSTGQIRNPDNPGVSAGHFDYDIYYHTDDPDPYYTATSACETGSVCDKPGDVTNEAGGLSNEYCGSANGFTAGYEFLQTNIEQGEKCGKNKFVSTISCCAYETSTISRGYSKEKHVHEYDDKYDVTGVNMLNASDAEFNLVNAIPSTSTRFKVLVMNQYLNPAVKLAIGPDIEDYENVKTYGGLAIQTDADILLNALPVYTRDTIENFIFNLPLDAFSVKNWWLQDGDIRAGLIPTQTGCVNKVEDDGSNPAENLGPNGERFNGALTIQLIKDTTPASALELNYRGTDIPVAERVKYGWRVKQEEFNRYVLAEYTAFWHHPNGACYGDDDWTKTPPQDPDSGGTSEPPEGTADPRDGVFSGGSAYTSVVTTVSGDTTTTVTRYADNTTYTLTETLLDNGYREVIQILPNGERVVTLFGQGGSLGAALGPTVAPYEEPAGPVDGRREAWRELAQ